MQSEHRQTFKQYVNAACLACKLFTDQDNVVKMRSIMIRKTATKRALLRLHAFACILVHGSCSYCHWQRMCCGLSYRFVCNTGLVACMNSKSALRLPVCCERPGSAETGPPCAEGCLRFKSGRVVPVWPLCVTISALAISFGVVPARCAAIGSHGTVQKAALTNLALCHHTSTPPQSAQRHQRIAKAKGSMLH
jgi:hypothetical protein